MALSTRGSTLPASGDALLADEDDDLFKDNGENKGNNGDVPDADAFETLSEIGSEVASARTGSMRRARWRGSSNADSLAGARRSAAARPRAL